MKIKFLKRIATILLCVSLCTGMAVSLTGTAYAADTEPPVSGISIQISLPSNWADTSAAVKFCITDETGAGFASAQIKTELDGNWQDVTNRLEQWDNRHYGQVSISDNGTVYVKVTGHDEKVYEESRYIESFDRTVPTVQARISGQLLRIEASDSQSGVTEISIGSKKYTNLTNGKLDVPLKDLGITSDKISVYAVDCAGNKSQIVEVQNPANQTSASRPEPSVQPQKPVTAAPTATQIKTSVTLTTTTSPAVSTSAVTTPTTDKNTDTAQIGKPLTPDGQGAVVDNATNEDGKEFFTIATQDENTFHLVIDKQRGSDNVYFLDTVKESDLLSLAEKDAEPPSQSAIPDPEPVCNCIDKCVPGAVKTDCPVCVLSLKDCTGKAPVNPTTEEPEKPSKPEKDNSSTIIIALIVALAVGGAGYYFKIYKPKKALDDVDDFDDLTGEDEDETINEDDDEPAPRHSGSYSEPDEPEYPVSYYDEPGGRRMTCFTH